jgi:ADP-heptose:LPS heptosyltransferase
MKRILLVKLRPLGDVILGARAFAAVRKANPGAFISILVQPPAGEILKFSGWVNEVFTYSKASLDKQGFFSRLMKESRLMDALKKRHFGVAADFYGSHRSARLMKASGADLQIGLDMPETAGFYDIRVPAADRLNAPAPRLDARVAAFLGAEETPEVVWPVPPSALEAADRFFETQGWEPGTPVVAVNPFASCASKEWPAQKWAGVVRALETKGLKVFFTCAPLETPRMAALEKVLDRKLPLYEGATLTPLMGLYRRSKAVVSVDSGPRHLAAAVGTPTVTVWGPELPIRWHPYDLKKHPLAVREVSCRPCGLSVCVEREHECLAKLEPAEVIKAIKTVVG